MTRIVATISAMDDLAFLDFKVDLNAPETVEAYDELPLWSAMFGLLLLDEVPMAGMRDVLDVGCGTGFPLIELAERLGSASHVHGVDPWSAGLTRARKKITIRQTANVTLHDASANALPFPDSTFDLIVSNLGINNFDDRDTAMQECHRVAKRGGTIALTTNVQGHMRGFYDAFEEVLPVELHARLREHVEHRATIASVRALLETSGFTVRRVVEREGLMRFASGSALLNHYFIKLGFLDGWKSVAGDREIFDALRKRLDAQGELRLTIPMAYVDATAR